MGKIILTPGQRKFIDKFSKDERLRKQFYLGGGTALSAFYLHHRFSEDLDFFCERQLDKDLIIKFVNKFAKDLGTTVKMTKKQTVLLLQLQHKEEILKIDFLQFPYPPIEKGIVYRELTIDSPKDIGANKLMTINLQPAVKDYVDLYFLLKEKFSLWDLLYAVEAKYKLQLDLIGLGEDFLAVEKFDYLPEMIKPLTLAELKAFFRNLAAKIGEKVVK